MRYWVLANDPQHPLYSSAFVFAADADTIEAAQDEATRVQVFFPGCQIRIKDVLAGEYIA